MNHVVRRRVLLLAVVIAGALLRGVGCGRGESNLAIPSTASSPGFFHFHPDETTLLTAAIDLHDPLAPPLTAYGLLPLYLARAIGGVDAWYLGRQASMADPEFRRLYVLSARAVAWGISVATLILLAWMGRQFFGHRVALLAVSMAAFPPLALQQAHFFTVDGVFTMLALASLGGVMMASGTGSRRWYLLSGVLIGLTAAVRLNGVSLGVILLLAHLFPAAGRPVWRRCTDPGLWSAAAAALMVLVSLQPFLLTEPGLLAQARTSDDFGYSMAVARGEILRPWTLADLHTVPFLHYGSELWPQSAGWPLTLLFAGGVIAILWRRRGPRLLLLAWLAIYFLPVGALLTKHTRYLLPMLPALCLLAAAAADEILRSPRLPLRRVAAVVLILVLGATAVKGIAFVHIYTVEDARLQAARWLRSNAAAGDVVAVERGGFSMRWFIDSRRHPVEPLNTMTIFTTRGYLTCGAAADYLAGRLARVDWIALTDVNRYRQYTAAADRFPALASFYTALLDGDLGFAPAVRYKVCPQLFGWQFCDDGAEVSFLGFDHPAAIVLRRQGDLEEAFGTWRQSLTRSSDCEDAALHAAAAALDRADRSAASRALRRPRRLAPLANLLQQRFADPVTAAGINWQPLLADFDNPNLTPWLLPWATAASLVDLGLFDQAFEVLQFGWRERDRISAESREPMSVSYMYIAQQFDGAGREALEEGAYLFAVDIWTHPRTLKAAAIRVMDRGDYDNAVALYEASVQQDPRQVDVWLALAAAAVHRADMSRLPAYVDTLLTRTDEDLEPHRDHLLLLSQVLEGLGLRHRAGALRRRAGEVP